MTGIFFQTILSHHHGIFGQSSRTRRNWIWSTALICVAHSLAFGVNVWVRLYRRGKTSSKLLQSWRSLNISFRLSLWRVDLQVGLHTSVPTWVMKMKDILSSRNLIVGSFEGAFSCGLLMLPTIFNIFAYSRTWLEPVDTTCRYETLDSILDPPPHRNKPCCLVF